MADKHLTESEWRKLAKGKGWKDADLARALGSVERAKGPEAELAALEVLLKAAVMLAKALKADKEASAYLSELTSTAERRQGTARAALKAEQAKAAKAQKDANADEDDEPAALTKGMVPLLRSVQKGLTLNAMVVTDGKAYGVLLSKRPLTPAKSKLIKDYLGLSAAKPPMLGPCLFESNAITFVLEGKSAGLAKKIKAALLAQTEMRWKVRVRGTDPQDVDEDLEEGEAPKTAGDPSQGEAQRSAFEARAEALAKGVDQASESTLGAAAHVQAVWAFAQEKARAGAWAVGLQALEQVERLMGQWRTLVQSEAVIQAQLQRSRQTWGGVRSQLDADLKAIEVAVLTAVRAHNADPSAADTFDEGAVVARMSVLKGLLDRLDAGLLAALDAALQAKPEARPGLRAQAAQRAAAARAFVDTDPQLGALEANGFAQVNLRARARTALEALNTELADAAA